MTYEQTPLALVSATKDICAKTSYATNQQFSIGVLKVLADKEICSKAETI